MSVRHCLSSVTLITIALQTQGQHLASLVGKALGEGISICPAAWHAAMRGKPCQGQHCVASGCQPQRRSWGDYIWAKPGSAAAALASVFVWPGSARPWERQSPLFHSFRRGTPSEGIAATMPYASSKLCFFVATATEGKLRWNSLCGLQDPAGWARQPGSPRLASLAHSWLLSDTSDWTRRTIFRHRGWFCSIWCSLEFSERDVLRRCSGAKCSCFLQAGSLKFAFS